jgi:hypothetical protein
MRTAAPAVLALALATLCACSRRAAPTVATPATRAASTGSAAVYRDPAYRFAIAVPPQLSLRHDFTRSYLGAASWKAYADDDSHGAPVLALVLNGSNTITAAELRIGVGTDADALAHCTDVPASAAPPGTDTVVLDGVPFTHFHAADAAMSHYLDVDAYRAVHAGRCYAIDLLLTGTRPEVYDPPATPPLSQAEARKRLRAELDGFGGLP